MAKTALLHLELRLANDTHIRALRNVLMPVALTGNILQEREYQVADSPVTYIGLASAKVTVLIPTKPVDLNFTIGSATVTMNSVSSPVVLPCAITSVQMQASASDVPAEVYIFQGT